jgi:hypothetical protein
VSALLLQQVSLLLLLRVLLLLLLLLPWMPMFTQKSCHQHHEVCFADQPPMTVIDERLAVNSGGLI